MISSGELFLLNGDTAGEFQPLPAFLNHNIRVISASLGRAYVVTEPAICPQNVAKRPSTVWCFEGGSSEPVPCPEFDVIEDDIKQIAIGEKHILVLTHSGDVYSRGEAMYGNAGHGGSKDVPEFRQIPALKGRHVKFVEAGPHFSIAITMEGDVFSWGQAFSGETGLFTQVDTVPRYASAVAPFKVTEVSCGHSHVLGRTETQHCIAWGENTSGQLGLGQKTKPTHKPQLLESIPSQVQCVSAGWGHSIAVGTDGRVYSWGLNSHGQLGLGDTATRFSPHLLHALTGKHEVESAHASKVSTLFQASRSRPLLCGRIPNGAASTAGVGGPRRPGESDPPGCLLCPVPLSLASGMGMSNNNSELTQLHAFDRGALGFARSTVYKVFPSLAPVQGGTTVQVCVTGLPYERPKGFQTSGGQGVPVKVRLRSSAPLLDVCVPGKVVDIDTLEFTTPDVTLSPLGSVAEASGCAAVQLQVSIDDGYTWTVEKPGMARALGDTKSMNGSTKKRSDRAIVAGMEDLKGDFEAASAKQAAKGSMSTLLWYCRWPRGGPSHIEPSCAPVTGGTELLVHIQLPAKIPTDHLTVKFACKPLSTINDPEAEARAPMRRDAQDIINPCPDALSKLPLVGPLDVLSNAWLDPAGRGIRCVCPPLDAENVAFYEYQLELSLDGKRFLDRGLPFNIYDLRVTGLEPCLGSLTESTEVRLKTTGCVQTEIQKIRIDFPKELGWPSRILPGQFDHRTGEITFSMPELSAEVRRNIDKAVAESKAAAPAVEAEEGAATAEDGEAPAEPTDAVEETQAVDMNGGLAGLEVFVELSLNGQNFTEDRVHFTYHGAFEPTTIRVLSMPEGFTARSGDPKDKGKKGEETTTMLEVYPGSELACEVQNLIQTPYASIRVDLLTKVGEDEPAPFRTVELPSRIQMVAPAAPPSAMDDDRKGKKGEAPPAEEEPLPDVEMLVTTVPSIRTEELPDPSAQLLMCNMAVSLNGQCYVPITADPTWRLLPLPPEGGATEES